jgi:hypothetical protein
VAVILPEQLEELTEELSGGVDRDGYYASLPLHPEVLKYMGVKSHVYAISSAADAAEFIAGCHMSECPVCQLRFSGSPLEDRVCLNCYVTRDTAAPEEPCVVCQVENKFELHGKMLVACAQCKKHTCLACRDKPLEVQGGSFLLLPCLQEHVRHSALAGKGPGVLVLTVGLGSHVQCPYVPLEDCSRPTRWSLTVGCQNN